MIKNIKIIAVGKLPKEFSDIHNHYVKLLSNKIDVTEIIVKKNIQGPEIMNLEANHILDKINDDELVILLDLKGKDIDSHGFSKLIESNSDKKITFIIGGAYGFSDKVRKRANKNISFSKLTFPHMLARIILLEQIYRAKTISENHPYHK